MFDDSNAPSDRAGWAHPDYYSTIHAADLAGGRAAEVYARGAGGIRVWRLAGGDWSTLPGEGDFSDQAGWNLERYYATIQSADVDGDGSDELLGRFLTGMLTLEFDPTRNAWGGLSAQFPAYTSGDLKTAYEAINDRFRSRSNPDFDMRQSYATSDGDALGERQNEVQQMSRPSDVPKAAWDQVKTQILSELDDAVLVSGWYDGYLHDQASDLYVAESMDTSAKVLEFDVSSNEELAMEEWELFESVVEGLSVLDALPGGVGEASVVISSLIGGGTSAGFTVEEVNTALDGVEGTYLAIQQQLLADFNNALAGLADAKFEILGDYGLQSLVGGLIDSGAWSELSGDDLNTAIASADRGYARSVWQTITPEIWMAFRFPGNFYNEMCTGGSVDDYCDWEDPDGNFWQLNYTRGASSSCETTAYKFGPCQPVHTELRQQVFNPISSDCMRSWNDRCSFGASFPDVFLGSDGWENLPAWTCTAGAVSGLSCSQQR